MNEAPPAVVRHKRGYAAGQPAAAHPATAEWRSLSDHCEYEQCQHLQRRPEVILEQHPQHQQAPPVGAAVREGLPV